MRKAGWLRAVLLVGLTAGGGAGLWGQAGSAATQNGSGNGAQPGPELRERPAGEKAGSVKGFRPEGLIRLDVSVTDRTGQVLTGLDEKDFTLLDEGKPAKIVSFDAYGGMAPAADPPTLVIVFIDSLDASVLEDRERSAVEQYLRADHGQLAYPTMIISLEDTGFWLDAEPSYDGNALADVVEHRKRVRLEWGPEASFHVGGSMAPAFAERIDWQFADFPPVTALKALAWIAAAERQKAGRKVMLWVGPGVGMGSGAYPGWKYSHGTADQEPVDQVCPTAMQSRSRQLVATCPAAEQNVFSKVEWFATLLREARMVVDTFAVGESDLALARYRQPGFRDLQVTGVRPGVKLIDEWKQYATPPGSPEQANPMDLYKKALAVESGGQALPDGGGNLAEQMEACARGVGTFFTLTFDAARAAKADEYHALAVEVRGTGMTAHSTTGYYDEPYFTDETDPGVRRLTVAELETMVGAARGESEDDAARVLDNVELTERLSAGKLASLRAELRGVKAQQALAAVGDESAYLPLPGVGSDAAPDAAEQARILGMAGTYLDQTIPKLPDFFAARAAAQYEERPAFYEGNQRIPGAAIHLTAAYTASVLYRHGGEVVEQGKVKHAEKDAWMVTYGTFGPLLPAVRAALGVPGNVTWSRWEMGAEGKQAVFRYVVPVAQSVFEVLGCCWPSGDGTSGFATMPGYHGEIAVDAESGAILRVTVEAELAGFVPQDRSAMMVAYGPVTIGEKTYVLPVRSVSVVRQRMAVGLGDFGVMFRTWGGYETTVNEFTFTDYHMFRGEVKMLPGYTAAGTPPQ